jgi:stage V sporulation protein R
MMRAPTQLTDELRRIRDDILGKARGLGLEPFETMFEMVDVEELNEIAAYGGFPVRYPHWRFGMDYEQLRTTHTYGLSRIYELVINNDPCYAYLLRSNSLVMQKLVIAHVYGHSDFFKHNMWFAKTNRKMIDEMANHGTRVRRHIDRQGLERVEDFLDACLSLENLIDPHAPFQRDPSERDAVDREDRRPVEITKLPSKGYMDRFVNPPEFLEAQRRRAEAERSHTSKHFPVHPRQDVLGFLLQHAPLERWQRDVLDIVRDEAYYFAPQRQTKVMNEGFASWTHSRLLTTANILTDAEIVDFADHHAATTATSPGQLNPYKLGLELFRDIEDRWNRGRFGPEYEACDELAAKRRWDLDLGLGLEKVFEVRKIYNDVGFIDAFLTEEFCHRHKLFVYDWNPRTNRYEIAGRDFQAVKRQVLFGLTNLGSPHITVVDGNYGNRGELFLVHRHEGVDLRHDHAQATLQHLHRLWQRPIHLATRAEGAGKILAYDGVEHTEQDTADDGNGDSELEA